MKIKDVEKRTGITSYNIRFYEKENLLIPKRNPVNGYREYTEEDILLLNRIKMLRMLDIPVSDIRKILYEKEALTSVLNTHLLKIKEEENKIIERDGAWLVDGLLDVDEFKEFFHIDEELPGEEDDLYKTMGGLLNLLFGRIPKELDKAKWDGYTFEVIDMDNTRIDKILVTYEEPVVEQEEEKN